VTDDGAGAKGQRDELHVGICCSGGGIRSACFSFGALAELRQQGAFDGPVTLAAVSGGAFAATAYTVTCATSEIADNDPPPWSIGSPEMRELRSRCDYLASGTREQYWLVLSTVRSAAVTVATAVLLMLASGHLSGMLVSLVGSGQRRQLVALLVLVPAAVMFVISLLLVAVNSWRTRLSHSPYRDNWVASVSVPATAVCAVAFVAVGVLPPSLDWLHDAIGSPRPAEERRVLAFFPTLGSKAVVFLIVSGLATLVGFSLIVAAMPRPWRRRVRGLLATALATLILAGPLLWSFDGARTSSASVGLVALGIDIVLLVLFALLFDANSYSLFPMYRASLRKTLFWRRVGRDRCTSEINDSQSSTSRTELSRLTMGTLHELIRGRADTNRLGESNGHRVPRFDYKAAEGPGKFGIHPASRLLVLGAVNLTDRSTVLGTTVENFVFSEVVSSPTLGEASPQYEANALGDGEALDLGTVVAVSGAAVSPMMGRFTQRGVSLLLALLNLRLGVWLRNPASKRSVRRFARPTSVNVLLEAIASSTAHGNYVFVSDGGHYENLGLVELARQGCDLIVCVDASLEAPAEVSSFRHSISLLRGQGYEFEFDKDERPANDGVFASPVVFGWILDPDGRRMRLIHLRCERYVGMSEDLVGIVARHPRFPRHPTLHQFFSAELVDAYYLLGKDVASKAHLDDRLRPRSPSAVGGYWT
jgi:hypothetical protein